ncbi:MAG: hypothetical protein A3I00_05800 [Betaproteobacteria bacterium RIFCSPLOWO2_02_FULL_64_12]|nr:MAG: hypothetical protein A3I00_05800 [Betaproteobacteria bacterium RIFCSPLOWO2_02_FULL_64_12]
MFDKEDVNYRYAGGDPTAPSCATCEHLVAPGQCDLVRGLIRTVDVCDEYDGPLGEPTRTTGMGGDADPAARRSAKGAEAALEAFKEAYAKHPHAFDAFVSALHVFKEAYQGKSVVGDEDEDEKDKRGEQRVRLRDACDPENPNYDIDEAERLLSDPEHLATCERCAMTSLTGARPRRVRTSKVTTKKGKKATRTSEAVSTFREAYSDEHEITDAEVESAVAAYYAHYRAAEKRARMGRR